MYLDSDNNTYTALDVVFQVFRGRLTAQEELDFASVLPCVPRAIFVKDWDISDQPLPFGDRASLVEEVKAVRKHHNLTPDNAIQAAAWALRQYKNARNFQRVLDKLPPEARDFWYVEVSDPSELEQRII